VATADTPLEGSKLVVKILPVVMHCARCNADVELESVQSFRCPRCGELVGDLRQGRELEIEAIEIEEGEIEEAEIEAGETEEVKEKA